MIQMPIAGSAFAIYSNIENASLSKLTHRTSDLVWRPDQDSIGKIAKSVCGEFFLLDIFIRVYTIDIHFMPNYAPWGN